MTDTRLRGDSTALGLGLIWSAIVVFAASNSIVRLLADLGAENTIDGRNPISFCNVLFVGNTCAFLVLLVLYHRQWNRSNLKALSAGDWGSLIVLAVLSGALVPALVFLALENTSVTNVVMLGRIEPALFLLLAGVFLGEWCGRWTAIGAALALIGGLAVVLYEAGGQLGKGEWQVVAAAVTSAVATVISKLRATRIPLGIFTVFRTGLGVVVFYFTAAYLFGPMHFMDAFNPFLWKWMLVYGGAIVVLGQWTWFAGLPKVSSADVSLATACSPLFGLAFAFVVLGERPGESLAIGAGIIVVGIVVAEAGNRWQAVRVRRAADSVAEAVEHEGNVNFKGV